MPNKQSQQLVELVMERLKVNNHTELAIRIGVIPARALNPKHRSVPQQNLLQKVKNWTKGTNAPSFDQVMAMLSEAELLTPEAARLFPRSATAEGQLEAAKRALTDSQPGVDRRRSQGGRG